MQDKVRLVVGAEVGTVIGTVTLLLESATPHRFQLKVYTTELPQGRTMVVGRGMFRVKDRFVVGDERKKKRPYRNEIHAIRFEGLETKVNESEGKDVSAVTFLHSLAVLGDKKKIGHVKRRDKRKRMHLESVEAMN